MRRDNLDVFRRLGRHLAAGRIDELTLTTNGSQLVDCAEELAAIGVARVNVSLDSLDPERFRAITRRGRLDQVLAGITAAKRAGLAIRINTVALKGVNDDEFDRLLQWCGDEGFDLCLIETMPLGDVGTDRTERYLPLSGVRERLARRWTLLPSIHHTGGPARYLHVQETGRHIGFITPMSHTFCESCNRVRVTCNGRLFLCLGHEELVDLRTPLRASRSDIPLLAAIDDAIGRKPKGHDFIIDRLHRRPAVARHMNMTGG